MIWRPVVERIATLQEINLHYDIIDLLNANESLDLREEAEYRAHKASMRKS